MKPRASQSGFTLLEILVVVVLIAFMTGVAVLSVGGDNRDDKMKLEATRLAELLRLASEQAQMRGKEVGLELHADSYRFAVLQNFRWMPIEDEQAFHERRLEEPLELNIALDADAKELFGQGLARRPEPEGGGGKGGSTAPSESDEADEDEREQQAARGLKPQVFILSSGEISPFAIGLGIDSAEDEDKPRYWRIRVREDGQIRLDGPHEGSLRQELRIDTAEEREAELKAEDEQDEEEAEDAQ
ncbi:MAG: type II secretion system minor pseudopilin GspH [Gammaproteobacteria bacterium]|nr:type II secretion system minor pseudopilin GspH [Gammaproteobacteria bacterium]